MRKIDFTPKENVEDYLDTDFDLDMYVELTENDEWKGIFEPLDFFNIFYENLGLIFNNIHNPQGFIEHLEDQKFHIKKYYFLIKSFRDKLFRVLHHMPENDELMNFCYYIDSECDEVFTILYPEKQKELEIESLKRSEAFDRAMDEYFAKFTSFDKVERDLEHIDDIQEKIKILIKFKARFLKEKKDFSLDERFGEKCQIEIDILKELAEIDTPPPQTMIENNPKKYRAKHYVLAYLIECNAKGKSFPIGQKMELEKIGSQRIGAGKGHRFYREFNNITNQYDINKPNHLIEIGGENWRTIVKELSSEPETIEAYLQSKQL